MKNLLLAALMLLSGIAAAQPTTAEKAVRDSLFQDVQFRGIVYDAMYEIALDVTSDTTDYAISVRPFFDRLITTPSDQRGYFVDMIAQATLNNSQSVINLNGVQTVESQVEFILRTLGIWQGPVNPYMRQRRGVYAFPYDLSAIESRLEALENPE